MVPSDSRSPGNASPARHIGGSGSPTRCEDHADEWPMLDLVLWRSAVVGCGDEAVGGHDREKFSAGLGPRRPRRRRRPVEATGASPRADEAAERAKSATAGRKIIYNANVNLVTEDLNALETRLLEAGRGRQGATWPTPTERASAGVEPARDAGRSGCRSRATTPSSRGRWPWASWSASGPTRRTSARSSTTSRPARSPRRSRRTGS